MPTTPTVDDPAISTGDVDFTLVAHVYLNSTSAPMLVVLKGDQANVNVRDYTLWFDSSVGQFAFRIGR